MSLRRTLVLVLMLSCFTQPGVTSAAQSAGNLKKNSYFIQGAVKKPGVYPIDGAASVFKLITLAGGLSDRHASIAFIIRLSTQQNERTSSNFVPGNEYIVIRIDISGFLKGEVQNDVVLTAGDILNIPITDDFVLPNSRPGVTPPFLDTPPIQFPAPCRADRRCLALHEPEKQVTELSQN